MTDSRDMVLVPREPTEAMLDAAVDVDAFKLGDLSPLGIRYSPQELFRRAWTAMLSASPARGEGDAPVACRFCKGEGWEPDQNWEPRWPDVPQERQKGDGLIRCGWCLGDGTDPSPHPVPAAPAIKGVVTDEWAERFCEAVNWSPDGQECKTVEGQLRCVSFRDLAKGYILAAIATDPCTPATPAGEELREIIADLEIAVPGVDAALTACQTDVQELVADLDNQKPLALAKADVFAKLEFPALHAKQALNRAKGLLAALQPQAGEARSNDQPSLRDKADHLIADAAHRRAAAELAAIRAYPACTDCLGKGGDAGSRFNPCPTCGKARTHG